jgi:hypothetical protein
MIEKIITEQMKDKSRIESLKEKKRKMSETNNSIDQLKLLTRVSLGALPGVGRFHITADVKDVIREDHFVKRREEQLKEDKRQVRMSKEAAKYRHAISKANENATTYFR